MWGGGGGGGRQFLLLSIYVPGRRKPAMGFTLNGKNLLLGQQSPCMYGCMCHGLLKNVHAQAEDRTGDPSIYSLALYHVAIKAGLYRKAVQVYYIPNLYPVTFSTSILNSSSNSQKHKDHWKRELRSSNAHMGYVPRWAPFVTDS